MDESDLPVVKSIAEWEKEIEQSFEEADFPLDRSINMQEHLDLTDEQFAKMDGYGVQDNQVLDRLVALYRVECKRFKSFVPGVFGVYILMYGGLTPDDIAGILGVAIDRISNQVPVSEVDPLERMLSTDDDRQNDDGKQEG